MKKYFYSFAILLLSSMKLFGQCDSSTFGKLSAEVHGDTVILKNDTAYRNCGAIYSMGISKLNSDTLIWMQTDTGAAAYCDCHFNLSATIDSLHQGNYSVKVYYSNLAENDTCYIGIISFTITKSSLYLTPKILNQNQSSCFFVDVPNENESVGAFIKIYPNPTLDNIKIIIPQKAILEISNIDGQIIKTIYNNDKETTIDLGNLSSGVYIIRAKTDKEIVTKKFIKQ